jgi:hypothetical protein
MQLLAHGFSDPSSVRFTINAAIYAVNYNILRIQNGMGGLLYAN